MSFLRHGEIYPCDEGTILRSRPRSSPWMSLQLVIPGRLLSSRACFRFLDPLSLPEFLCSICQRSTGRSLRFRGLCTGISVPNTPHCLFRGRPVYHNSIFVDDA